MNSTLIKPADITKPSGGGTIRSNGETFQTNKFTGTGSYVIPIQCTPARGFEPSLQLEYNSGSGNGLWGQGFSLNLPSITLRTEKGIPQYNDTDVFIVSGVELTPSLQELNGQWLPVTRTEIINDVEWLVKGFRPRVDSAFENIELWTNIHTGSSQWKILTQDNTTELYGLTAQGRIADPANVTHIFQWLIEERTDSKGNTILYHYNEEGNISNIQYGNYYDDTTPRFFFELIADYGERNVLDKYLSQPGCDPYTAVNAALNRLDPFSSFRSGFEIRRKRLCQHLLLFHHIDTPCLVKKYSFSYNESPVISTMKRAQSTGCRHIEDGSYQLQKLPPFDFTFSVFETPVAPAFKLLSADGHTIPGYLNSSDFLPIDLFGEGLPGFLYSNGLTSMYLPPLGNGTFDAPQLLASFPVNRDIQDGNASLVDLNGTSQYSLVTRSGYYFLQNNKSWSAFQPFISYPSNAADPLMEQVDLSANGKTDLLLANRATLQVYPSIGKQGYDALQMVSAPAEFPMVKQGYEEELVTFADILGDGLPHRVRISDQSVECWPDMGYGKFGKKRMLINPPAYAGGLNNARLFLADLDGSGSTDMVYVYNDRIEYFINQSGNSFADGITVMLPEPYANIDSISFADITGNGTAAMIFSKMDGIPRHYYYEFTGTSSSEQVLKPYLLMLADNNRGASVHLQYCSSVKFYLEDKKAGYPWITRLPFPVQVLEKITWYDAIAKTKVLNTFKYHDGYYDPEERVFCGFAYVESFDTESFEAFSQSREQLNLNDIPQHLYVAPIHTKSWSYTGANDLNGNIQRHIQQQFFKGDILAYNMPASVFAGLDTNDYETMRQAFFALKGQPIREEVYALNGSNVPYTVSGGNNLVSGIQPIQKHDYAVFTVAPRESIAYNYECNTADPAVQQSFSQTDAFNNVVNSCSVYLPRRSGVVAYPEQQALKCTAIHTDYFNRPGTDWQLIGVEYQQKEYVVNNLSKAANAYFSWDEIKQAVFDNMDNPVFELLQWQKTFFWNETQTESLPLGELTARALTHHQQQAQILKSFTTELLTDTLMKDNGGYIEEEGYWWNAGMIQYYYKGNFYLPNETRLFHAGTQINSRTSVEYDAYYFMITHVKNWLSESDYNETIATPDYICFENRRVLDFNDNVWEVIFDPVGQVIVQSLYKMADETISGGMPLTDYQLRSNAGFDDVIAQPEYYLQGACSFVYYDMFAWMDNQQPLNAISLTRNLYYYESNKTTPFSCQTTISYADGSGRAVESKMWANETANDIWETSGRTVYNNKGKPCEQYLPFFSNTPYYENQPESPVPPTVTYYDPLLRVVKTVNPAGYFSAVTFSAWEEKHYDEDDNDIDSPFYNTPGTKVYDVMHRAFLNIEDNLGKVTQNAFEKIVSGSITSPELWQQLITKGYLQADGNIAWVTDLFRPYTPDFQLHLDAPYQQFDATLILFLKQQCLTSYHSFDMQGREIVAIDPRLYYSNITANTAYANFRYTYGLTGDKALCSDSADAGKRFEISNVLGKSFWNQSPRNFKQLISYDWLQRKAALNVSSPDGTTTTLVEVFTYGETQPDAKKYNLRGELYELKDQSGVITNHNYSLQQELLKTSRQLTLQYKEAINWTTAPLLNTTVYINSFTYDAVKRLLTQTTPDATITAYSYNPRGLLTQVTIQPGTATEADDIVKSISYNANRQRTSITYGNGSRTNYNYYTTTLRLEHLRTMRSIIKNGIKEIDDAPLQDIYYSYDPVGNITRIEDRSYESVFNNNQQVDPVSEYTYDALYRLMKSSGRQHPGILANTFVNSKSAGDFKQSKYCALPSNSNALENYTQSYTYDDSGNMLNIAHQATQSWTRTMQAANDSNRISMIITNGNEQPMQYDRSGNQKMLDLYNTVDLTWSCCENLIKAAIIIRPDELDDSDYYTYDSGELRVRKVSERMAQGGSVTEVQEKIYLGNYEEKLVKQVSSSAETITEHRQTLRVMDGNTCVAVVHYWVKDSKKEGERQIRYQLSNNIGSVSMELDPTAQLISYEEYFPYGGTAFIAGNNQLEVARKDYRYSGKECDDSTGLIYYGARYYAPWLARWLSPDPAERVDGLNLFAFVKGNPVAYNDVDGRQISLGRELDNRGITTIRRGDEQLVHYGVNMHGAGDPRYDSIARVGGLTMEAPWAKMHTNGPGYDVSAVRVNDPVAPPITSPELLNLPDIGIWTQYDKDVIESVYRQSSARDKQDAGGIREGIEFSKRSIEFNLNQNKTVIFHLDKLHVGAIMEGEVDLSPDRQDNYSNSVTAKELKFVLRLPSRMRNRVVFTRFNRANRRDEVVDFYRTYSKQVRRFDSKHRVSKTSRISNRRQWLRRDNLMEHHVPRNRQVIPKIN